jgi:PKD repeat protein
LLTHFDSNGEKLFLELPYTHLDENVYYNPEKTIVFQMEPMRDGKPGDYEIKLTVTTESGKIYSTSKKLILQPKPQTIKITTSMKTAPIYQEIDFLSDKSEGQIASYFWDF